MKLAHESKYHILVLLIYVFFCGYLIFFSTLEFNFLLDVRDLKLVAPLALGAFIALFAVNKFLRFAEFSVKKETLARVLLLVLYAIAFAIPEEIIFRGLIQSYLAYLLPDALLPIIFSALIYGFAHFQNGATSWRPKNWSWKFMAITAVFGLFLGFAFHLTGSLAIPVLLHALFIVFNQAFVKTK